jgi:tetratricopeptide (TPR) repeat protein
MGFPAKDPVIEVLQHRRLGIADLATVGPKPSEARAVTLALLYLDLLEVDGGSQTGIPVLPASSSPSSGHASVVSPPRPSGPHPTLASRPSGAHPTLASAAPAAEPPVAVANPAASAALRARIEDLFAKLDQLSHFEVMGVSESATAEEVTAAQFLAIRQLHPDRLAGVGLRELAPKAERVVARISEATAVLTDARKRGEYLQRRASPDQMAFDPARAIIEAEQIFKQGEALLKKGDYAHAVDSLSEAMKANPQEPEYRAWWAWARFENPQASKADLASDTLRIIEDVIKAKAKFALGHYWVGQVWKFLNDPAHAEKAFREAASLQKPFLEAERELRLIEMRRARATSSGAAAAEQAKRSGPGSRTTTATKGGGFLNKLLKR